MYVYFYQCPLTYKSMKMELNIVTLMLFAILSIVFSSQVHAQTRLSNLTDHQTLLAFKSHIISDPQKALETWNFNISLCSWRGVSCNITKQRVTGLDLGNLGLVGIITPHIGNLSFLAELNLQGNAFSGNIPQEIGNLFRLKTLNLSSNSLEGNVPASLSFCSRLIMLDLSENNLQGRLPSELGTLADLDALIVTDNYLTGEIPPSFSNLSSLTNLILKQNSLTGPIPEGLGHLPLIVNIDLSLNHLVGEIPPPIFNRSSLMQLGLVENQISGVLPSDTFSRLSNLANLYIGGNRFSGNLPVSLGNASNLVQADFSRNYFTGHVPLLWHLPNIQVLSFDTNQLVTDGNKGWDFLTSLENSTQLLVFSLASNLLTGKLPSSVGNLSRHLQQFVIGDNHLEGSFPDEISNLVGLTMLSVEYNYFSGLIPSTIGNLPILQNLYLHENNLTGEVPESLGNLTSLYEIALLGNKLNGTIPSSLGNLQHLRVLDFSYNLLKGAIPREIFNILNLGQLNLSSNFLHGYLPEQIGNLKTIIAIDLSNNNFTGNIPYSIGGCSSLEYLFLSQNSLNGSIPSSLADIKGIESIDLSSNKLSGDIPASLDSLMYLQVLNLSQNQLEGPIPIKGIFTNTSAVFLSGNSHLCGGIPEFHLSKCIMKHDKSAKSKLIVGLTVALVATLLLVSGASVFLFRKRWTFKATDATEESPQEQKYKLYTYYDLKSSTGNFSSHNLIGQGSFGSVYKGVLMDGTVAAIKVFNLERQGASKSFLAECEVLRNVRHRNLVRILSVCASGNFKALILPYMSNGSLDDWLHNKHELPREVGDFQFGQRLKIASNVASAMEYLHHDSELPIVHCDLKPSNVLLDENMCAHVSDFGIARIVNKVNDTRKEASSSSLVLKGSIGYIAPEYGLGTRVSTKGDVYSFGILLLELLTGKRPANEEFTGNMNLQEWVAKDFPKNVPNILDDNLVRNGWNSSNNDTSVAIFEIGLKCAAKFPEKRPTMRDMSLMINNIAAEF